MSYYNISPANLLVASNGPRKGVRIQASYIKREFVDDDLIGRGPPGNLYFNDIEDFASIVGDVPVLHSYKITEVLKDGHYNITVEFTNSVKGPSVPYAKFEGADHTRIIAQNGLNGYEFHGQWVKFDMVGISATLSKKPGDKNLILTFGSTRVTLINEENFAIGEPFEIFGDFFFKDNINLPESRRVLYTKGSVIFYRPRGVDPDHTAYFIPSVEFLPGQSSLFDNVHWGDVSLLIKS